MGLLLACARMSAQEAEHAAPVHQVDGSFVKEWLVLGPFPGKDTETDFLAESGGEANARPKAGDTVLTKEGRRLIWTRLRSARSLVNLEQVFGAQDLANAYAYCELNSDQAVETDLRAGCFFPTPIWLNGKQIGQVTASLDKKDDLAPVMPIQLNAGRNPCLLKLRTDRTRELLFDFQPLPQVRAKMEFAVANSEGKSIPGALIRIYEKGEPRARLRTDSTGRAEACLFPLADRYDLQLTSGEMGTWLFDVTLRPGERRKMEVVLPKAVSISGRVLGMDGSPQKAIVVQAVRASGETGQASESPRTYLPPGSQLGPGENVKIPSVLGMPAFSETVQSDTNGVFRLVNLRPGQYRLRAHGAHGYVYPEGDKEPDSSKPIVVEPGRTHDRTRFVCGEVKKGVWLSFPIKQGLTELSTRRIHRTPDGMLWIGTDQGTIHQYDGVEFETFSASEIQGTRVRFLDHDQSGTLWIGSSMGISRKLDGRIQTLPWSDTLPRKDVPAMSSGADGTLWLGTASGLAKYDGQRLEMLTLKDGLPSSAINSLLRTKDGALWLGCWSAVARFDGKNFSEPLPVKKADKLHQARDGAIWMCAQFGDRGAFRYDGQTLRRVFQEDGLLSDEIYDIAETSDGVLWFATRQGLSSFDGRTILNYTPDDGLNNEWVRAIFVDADDVLWCATGGGISRFDPKGFSGLSVRDGLKAPKGSPSTFAIEPDERGGYWVGTAWGGLYRVEDRQRQLSLSAVHPDHYIRQVLRFDGTLWLGTANGIFKQADGKLAKVLDRGWVLALNSDPQGNLWYGQGWTGGGLSRYNPTTREETTFNSAQGLPDDHVWAIERNAAGGLWIGTGSGLTLYRDGRLEDMGKQLGLPTGSVFNLREDAEGTLWISSKVGLHRLVPVSKKPGAPADGVAKSEREAYKLISLTVTNGLPDQHIWTSTRTRDGIIWMGTANNGLLGYDGQAVTVIDKRDGLLGNQVFALKPNLEGSLLLGFLEGGVSCYSPTKTPPSWDPLESTCRHASLSIL